MVPLLNDTQEKPLGAVEEPRLETNCKKSKHLLELQGEKHRPDQKKERPLEEHRIMKKADEQKREKQTEVSKKHSSIDNVKRSRDEYGHREKMLIEPQREKAADVHKPLFERLDKRKL